MKHNLSVLAISYGRQLFDKNNPERKRLLACSHEVVAHHIIVFTHQKDNLRKQQEDNLFLYPTNSKSKIHMLFDACRLGGQILAQKSRWVITAQDPFETSAVGLYLARKCRLPLNIQEHGDFFSTKYWRFDKVLNQIRYLFGKWTLRRATTVRVVSKRIVETMVRLGVSKEKIIYLPVRSDSINASHGVVNIDKTSGGPLIIVGMGRFVAQKNFPLLLRAFAALVDHQPHVYLKLVGKGELRRSLELLIKQLGLEKKVEIIDWSDNPQSIIATADIFALSSDWEGWARVLVEAMAAGTPIVTTNVGCAGEVVLDGVHGFVVPVRDEKAFARKLCCLASDQALRTQFRSNALRDTNHSHTTLEEYTCLWSAVMVQTAAAA